MRRLLHDIKQKLGVAKRELYYLLRLTLLRKKDMVFLFCSPFHPNMGDHAQTLCIQKWYNSNFPNYDVLILQSTITSRFLLNNIRRFIRSNDKLVCHSGYHLTNLYHEQDVYFGVIEHFKDFPIVIFPQTINYTNQESLDEARKILNSHPNLTIMCRDEKSFSVAKENFTNPKLMLMPDIVTSLIGTKQYNYDREGILFCMRNDIEAFYSKSQIQELQSRFTSIKTSMTDTDRFDFSMKYLYAKREEAVNQVIDEFAHYKLVITDRYHGTIFSQIAGTPVVVIGSSDHKLSSGVKWFPKDIFGKYVTFARNLEEAYTLSNNILSNYSEYDHHLPPYFKNKYFENLKDVIY